MLPAGTQLGNYRIVSFIKRGGMGEVYQAEDTRIPRQVAIKTVLGEQKLYPNPIETMNAEQLFQREMQAIAQLDHPNILPLLDFGKETSGNSSLTYMVMPLRLEGSLLDWIQKRSTTEPLPPTSVAHFIRQAAGALQYAHNKGFIHRDVKPSNFLVRERSDHSELPDLLLADFGIAKVTENSRSSTNARGTLEYMSPEQLSGHAVPASDQYSLAVMAYELLTGTPPFTGSPPQVMFQHVNERPKPPSSLNTGLPKAIDEVLLRALAKNPQDRYPSIQEFGNAFQKAASGQRSFADQNTVTDPSRWADNQPANPPDPPRRSPTPLPRQPRQAPTPIPPPKPSRTFPTGVLIALLVALLVLAGGVGIAYGSHLGGTSSQGGGSTGGGNTDAAATTQAQNQANANATAQAQNQANATAQAQNQANADATAQAQSQANADATAQANADATAQARNQASADATATANAQPAFPVVAGSYTGTYRSSQTGTIGTLALTLQQSGSNLSGTCWVQGVAHNIYYAGVNAAGTLQFTIFLVGQAGTERVDFIGAQQSDGSLRGEYAGNAGRDTGTWNVSKQ